MFRSFTQRCVSVAARYCCIQPPCTPVRSMMQSPTCPVSSSLFLPRPSIQAPPVCVQSRSMTINQKVRNPTRRPKPCVPRQRTKRPFYKAVVLRVLCLSPKKPNSGQRKVVRARITYTNKTVLAHVPGEGHTLQEHQVVLLKHTKVPDTSGLHLQCIRGKYDLKHVQKKK